MITKNVHIKINKALAMLVVEDYNMARGWVLEEVSMDKIKTVNIEELNQLSKVGNSDFDNDIQPQSSAVLCSFAVTVLTSPFVTTVLTAVANCEIPERPKI